MILVLRQLPSSAVLPGSVLLPGCILACPAVCSRPQNSIWAEQRGCDSTGLEREGMFMRRMLEWQEWEVYVPTASQPDDSTRHCSKQEHFRVRGPALGAAGPLCRERTYQDIHISRDRCMYTPQGGISLNRKGHTRHSAAAAQSLVD